MVKKMLLSLYSSIVITEHNYLLSRNCFMTCEIIRSRSIDLTVQVSDVPEIDKQVCPEQLTEATLSRPKG